MNNLQYLVFPIHYSGCFLISQVRLVRSHPKSAEFKSSYEESYMVYKRYQMTIHNDSEGECDKTSYDGFLVESPLEVPILAFSTLSTTYYISGYFCM